MSGHEIKLNEMCLRAVAGTCSEALLDTLPEHTAKLLLDKLPSKLSAKELFRLDHIFSNKKIDTSLAWEWLFEKRWGVWDNYRRLGAQYGQYEMIMDVVSESNCALTRYINLHVNEIFLYIMKNTDQTWVAAIRSCRTMDLQPSMYKAACPPLVNPADVSSDLKQEILTGLLQFAPRVTCWYMYCNFIHQFDPYWMSFLANVKSIVLEGLFYSTHAGLVLRLLHRIRHYGKLEKIRQAEEGTPDEDCGGLYNKHYLKFCSSTTAEEASDMLQNIQVPWVPDNLSPFFQDLYFPDGRPQAPSGCAGSQNGFPRHGAGPISTGIQTGSPDVDSEPELDSEPVLEEEEASFPVYVAQAWAGFDHSIYPDITATVEQNIYSKIKSIYSDECAVLDAVPQWGHLAELSQYDRGCYDFSSSMEITSRRSNIIGELLGRESFQELNLIHCNLGTLDWFRNAVTQLNRNTPLKALSLHCQCMRSHSPREDALVAPDPVPVSGELCFTESFSHFGEHGELYPYFQSLVRTLVEYDSALRKMEYLNVHMTAQEMIQFFRALKRRTERGLPLHTLRFTWLSENPVMGQILTENDLFAGELSPLRNTTLMSLDLSECNLYAMPCLTDQFLTDIMNHPNLQELNLSKNTLHQDGCQILAAIVTRMLEERTQLHTLDLSDNDLRGVDLLSTINDIRPVMEQHNLSSWSCLPAFSLNLSNNMFEDDKEEILSVFSRVFKTVKAEQTRFV